MRGWCYLVFVGPYAGWEQKTPQGYPVAFFFAPLESVSPGITQFASVCRPVVSVAAACRRPKGYGSPLSPGARFTARLMSVTSLPAAL
jgi:hypothetical protein